MYLPRFSWKYGLHCRSSQCRMCGAFMKSSSYMDIEVDICVFLLELRSEW
uniref:Uncharacterized protein n=1 Tax=Arundo donax TaxID=35708 RepID=A0A0A9A920_ARUDO